MREKLRASSVRSEPEGGPGAGGPGPRGQRPRNKELTLTHVRLAAAADAVIPGGIGAHVCTVLVAIAVVGLAAIPSVERECLASYPNECSFDVDVAGSNPKVATREIANERVFTGVHDGNQVSTTAKGNAVGLSAGPVSPRLKVHVAATGARIDDVDGSAFAWKRLGVGWSRIGQIGIGDARVAKNRLARVDVRCFTWRGRASKHDERAADRCKTR